MQNSSIFFKVADWFPPMILSNNFCSSFLKIAVYGSAVLSTVFLTVLYMTDMNPVLEITPMVPSFPQES